MEVDNAGVPKLGVKSLSELNQETTKWCLLSDNELQRYLKQFSSDLFSKTKKVQDQLDTLYQDTSRAEVRLHNAFNQFLMLSNTQFIENRVYDEEEMATAIETAQMTEEEEEEPSTTAVTTVVEKYRSSLEMGLQAMKLFAMIDEEDTLEEEDALDIYNERPLPFIIGTQDFLEDDTLGLGAAPDEEDENESTSSSEESAGTSHQSSSSEDLGPPPLPTTDDWSSAEEEEASDSEIPIPAAAEEDNSSSEEEKKLFSSPKSTSSAAVLWSDEEDDDLFAYRPTALDPKLTKQESNYSGLFADDDDEEEKQTDLFNADDIGGGLFTARASNTSTPRASHSIEHQQSARSTGNSLFGQEEDSEDEEDNALFSGSLLPVKAAGFFDEEPVMTKQPSIKSQRGLFDGDSSEEEDDSDDGLFAFKPKTTTKDTGLFDIPAEDDESSLFNSPKANAANQKDTGLFDTPAEDDESSLFNSPKANSTTAAAISVSSDDEELNQPATQRKDSNTSVFSTQSSNLFGSSAQPSIKSDIGLFDQDQPSVKSDIGLFGQESITQPSVKSDIGLFGQESGQPSVKSDIGLFGQESTTQPSVKSDIGLFGQESTTQPSVKSDIGLFGQDQPSVKSDIGLFGQDQPSIKSDIGLFGQESNTQASVQSDIGLFGQKSGNSSSDGFKPSSGGLFDDDSDISSDDGLFGSSTITSSSAASKPAVVEDDNLFGPSTATIVPPPLVLPTAAMVEDGASDSDNEWSDDDDTGSLFGTSKK